MRVPFTVRALPAFAFRAWLTPPPLPASTQDRDRETLSSAIETVVGDTRTYEFGAGPVALALHGWGGRPAQMAPMAERLARAGYRVLVPELPGRAGGAQTDIKQVAASVEAVLSAAGQPDLVVAHSFAAMVLRLVFTASAPPAVLLIAPALQVEDALAVFSDRLGLLPWTRRRLRSRLESWDPGLWPSMAGIAPDQMPGSRVIIIHDPADPDTPFSRSAELSVLRPETTLLPFDGVGHNRILSNPEVLERVVASVVSAA